MSPWQLAVADGQGGNSNSKIWRGRHEREGGWEGGRKGGRKEGRERGEEKEREEEREGGMGELYLDLLETFGFVGIARLAHIDILLREPL